MPLPARAAASGDDDFTIQHGGLKQMLVCAMDRCSSVRLPASTTLSRQHVCVQLQATVDTSMGVLCVNDCAQRSPGAGCR